MVTSLWIVVSVAGNVGTIILCWDWLCSFDILLFVRPGSHLFLCLEFSPHLLCIVGLGEISLCIVAVIVCGLVGHCKCGCVGLFFCIV